MLAKGEVKHVGDPVALVIGDDRYAVVDAAEDVVVEYDPLPVVTDPEKALEEGSPLVHEQFGTNKVCDWSIGGGDLEAGFAAADVIIERRIVNHRMAGAAIEPRGVLAEYRGDRLTVWSSTQVPHFLRLFLVDSARHRRGPGPSDRARRSGAASVPSSRSTPRKSAALGRRASSDAR